MFTSLEFFVAQRSKLSWFFAGIVAFVLITAAANAASFFVRSGSWQPLFNPNYQPQALGFPFEIWRLGKAYSNGTIIDHHSMFLNVSIGLGFGTALGIVFVCYSNWLNRFIEHMADQEAKSYKPLSTQFSIGGLLTFTLVLAIVFGVARFAVDAEPSFLVGIYLLGPAALIVLAMIPRGLTWQARVFLLAPSTLLLIGFTMYVGIELNLLFDHVMLGVFVCWVPQTVVAAGILLIRLGFQFARSDAEPIEETKLSS